MKYRILERAGVQVRSLGLGARTSGSLERIIRKKAAVAADTVLPSNAFDVVARPQPMERTDVA